MIPNEQIQMRYNQKQVEFKKPAQVTLVGHSLWDFWDIAKINGKSVANLSVGGINSQQYLDFFMKQNLITHLGEDVFMFLGVNDIAAWCGNIPFETVLSIVNEVFTRLKTINPNARFYFLEATPVDLHDDDVENSTVLAFNEFAKKHLLDGVIFVPTFKEFCDEKGVLKSELHTDGLHFSAKGYEVLETILKRYLK